MDDRPQLRLTEIVELTHRSLRCTVRCVAGTVWLGDTVELLLSAADRLVAEGLTVSAIELAGGVPMDFVDLGRTALVTATGPIDGAALRAVLAGFAFEQVVPADLRLIVRRPAGQGGAGMPAGMRCQDDGRPGEISRTASWSFSTTS